SLLGFVRCPRPCTIDLPVGAAGSAQPSTGRSGSQRGHRAFRVAKFGGRGADDDEEVTKLGRTLGILVASALALAWAPRAESFDGEGNGGSGGNGPEPGCA